MSGYIDQNTGLQDEIAGKLADVYNAGFRFCYMDGSEGVSAPYEFNVPNAQYRVLSRFADAPLFTEGAAKAHFSWHFQAGANAFDIFPPPVFKRMIARFPAEEAPRMRQDFTRLDFGWWGFWAPRGEDNGTQADMYEYGTSRAAAWDCPATIQSSLERFRNHPRTGDILEVMRRWEDVRARGWLTDAQKDALKNLDQEHTLLIDERGGYELFPCDPIEAPENVSAFAFERAGERYVVYWHQTGAAQLYLPLDPASFTLSDRIGGEAIETPAQNGGALLPADNKRYLRTALSRAAVEKAFAAAALL